MSDDIKICVYGICKNESKFIDRWYKWASKADYIRILDTGSTDDTVEKLSKLDKVEVHEASIIPWRFDVARNMSMQYIPEDTDICCTADFDQVWVDGWDEELKRLYREGYNDICGDIIDYDENNNEIKRFLSRNVHTNIPGWHWERPIHEGLHYSGDQEIRQAISDKFIIEHHPDPEKSRGDYLALLETEYKENHTDPMCMIYYGCELSFHDRNEEAHEVFLKGLEECDFSEHPEVLYQTNINIAIQYRDTGEYDKALKYALDARNVGLITRRVNCLIAGIYSCMDDHYNTIKYCKETLSVKSNLKDWREDVYLFTDPSPIYNLIAYSEYSLKDYYNAYLHEFIATVYNPTNEGYKYNLDVYKEEIRKYKVAMYAICKNEIKNIDVWYATAKQADYVFVLDTGSTDESVERLKEYGVEVETFLYKEFSFGRARQDALNALLSRHPDVDVCITVDFDEFLRYDWYVKLQQQWDPNYDGMIVHGYNMDRTPNCDSNNKIHIADTDKIKWIRDIHEFIDYRNKALKMSDISYIHNQDLTKNRNYYEYTSRAYMRKERSILDCVYYAWESSLIGNNDDAYKANLTALSMFSEEQFKDDPSYNDKELEAQVCINIGRYCYKEASLDLAFSYFNIASQLDLGFDYRRIHCIKAFMYEQKEEYDNALQEYLSALNINTRPYCWIEDNAYYDNAYVELHLLKILTEHFEADELKEQIINDAKEKYPDCEALNIYSNTGIVMVPRCELEV